MRVLSIDPGAERLGWAVLQKLVVDDVTNTSPALLDFGIDGIKQGKSKYQEYRLNLIDYWVDKAKVLLDHHKPDLVVTEIVPPVGGGAFRSNGIQSQLATAAVTALQAMAMEYDYPVKQIAAITVKTQIGGNRSATKQQVRNGVINILPILEPYRKEWTKVFDISDAIAIGLCYLGYSNRKA